MPAAATPAWSRTVVPGLVGATQILTGEKNFVRDSASVTLDYDLGALDRLDPGQVDALFALLAADPEWRVGFEPGGRVATRRDTDGPGVAGWHVGVDRCRRIAVTEHEEAAFAGPRVTTAPASVTSVKIAAYRPTEGPPGCRAWATALLVDGVAADLEVFEAGDMDTRPWTIAALEDVPRLVSFARIDAATLAAQGHTAAPPALPDSRYEAGTAGWRAERAVNPGGPGRTWLRLLDAAGTPWHEGEIGPQTLQQVGWSPDPAHRFLAGSLVALPAGPAGAFTAEWWFQGADGVPRKLAADPVTLPAR